MARYLSRLAAVAASLVLTGCGSGLNPVKGRVTFEDGTPLPTGMVVSELIATGDAKRHSANGNIKSDGSFELTTLKPGDGVPEGRYRAAVLSPSLSDEQRSRGEKPLVDSRFSELETSGLEFEVKSGGNSDVNFTVARPGGGNTTKK